MGQLDLPVLPPLLYRYRRLTPETIDREIDAIRQQLLWCAFYKKLNDPMEGFYKPSQRVQNLDAYTQLTHDLVGHKQTIGICCFSDIHDNELMWTHYAGNYSGICVSYRARKLLDGLPDHAHLVRLSYGVEPPEIGLADTHDHGAAVRKILSHKKSSWAYEREWRVLADQGPLPATVPGCIQDVFLGSRIDPTHRKHVRAALAHLPVRLHTMQIEKYEHKWKLNPAKKPLPQLAAE